MNLKDKTIVVSGGGSGVGRSLVLGLIKKGAKVAAIDIHESTLLETKQLLNDEQKNRLSTHVLNIADKASVETTAKQLIEKHLTIDGLINNAGIIQPFVKVNDLDFKTIERIMNVNFFGTLYMTKAFLPHLLTRSEASLVNISSMGGFMPFPGQSIYGASKAAIKLLTESLYMELIDTKVSTMIVFPGAMDTNIAKNSGVEMNLGNSDKKQQMKAISADIAAQAIIEAIEKNKSRLYLGSDSKMLNTLYRISPAFAMRFIAKKMKDLLK